jgi:hypothetical protein
MSTIPGEPQSAPFITSEIEPILRDWLVSFADTCVKKNLANGNKSNATLLAWHNFNALSHRL